MAERRKRTFEQPTWSILKWVILFGSAGLVAYQVPFEKILPILGKCRLGYLAVSVAISFAVALVLAIRWRYLFQKPDLGLRKYLYFVFLGMFFNMVSPSAMATEAVKTVAFGKKYGHIGVNIGIAVWCKLIGAVLQIFLGGIGLVFYARDMAGLGVLRKLSFPYNAWIPAVAALLGLTGLMVWYRIRLRRPIWLDTVIALSRRPGQIMATFALTFTVQILTVMSGYFVFLSLYPEANFWQVLFSSVVISAVLTLPFSLGGIGVREFLNLLLYSQLGGIPPSIVFSVNLLGYIPLLAPALFGFLWMSYRRWQS